MYTELSFILNQTTTSLNSFSRLNSWNCPRLTKDAFMLSKSLDTTICHMPWMDLALPRQIPLKNIYLSMVKHQSKPQVYKSDITQPQWNRLKTFNAYLLSEDRMVGEATYTCTSTKVLSFWKYDYNTYTVHMLGDCE